MSISELFNTSNEWTKLKVAQISAENGGTLKGCDMKNCTLTDCNISSIVTKRENAVATPPAGYDRIFINSSNILSTKKDDGTISQYQKIGELPPISGNLNMNNYDIINSNQINANGYISSNTGFKIEGAPLAYLLTDGSYSTVSASQSNLYLYKFSNVLTPPPQSGHIRFNSNILNSSCTHIYIDHITQDGSDIENIAFNQISQLDIVYIQNRDVSSDYVKYNVVSRNILIEQYVDITVSFNSGSVTSFNNNHNLILSFFTNDIELNNRLTTLETKTQHITANNNYTIFVKTILQNIGDTNSFNIRNSTDGTNILDVSRNIINAFKPLNMQAQSIYNISSISAGSLILTSAPSISFVKSNGTFDSSVYAPQSSLNTTNSNVTNLSNNLSTNYTDTINSDLKYATITNLDNTNTNVTNLSNNLSSNYSTSATNETIYQKISDMNLYTTNANLTTNYYTNLTSDNKYFFKTGGILSGSLNMGNNAISGASSISIQGGLSSQFLKADGSVSGGGVESVTDSWRYMSWGYIASATVTVVDCATGLMTNIGGSLATIGINSSFAPKGYKIRAGSNVSSTTNGATSGWIGTALQNFIIPRAGWYIKIGFSLDAVTTTATGNRTMIGLFQSTARPVLDNTTTIASVLTNSMGIVQEKGETVFSFNTRGLTGSTKIATSVSCETPNNNFYILEMLNEPDSATITLILTAYITGSSTQTATTSFICGGANTMAVATSYVHLQQSMASPGGVPNSAFLTLGNITMKLAQ